MASTKVKETAETQAQQPSSQMDLQRAEPEREHESGPAQLTTLKPATIARAAAGEGMPPGGGAAGRARAMRSVQRTLGNRRAMRMAEEPKGHPADPDGPNVQRLPIQPKLTVGKPGDKYEQEADAAARRVEAGQPVDKVSRLPAGGLAQPLQRQPEEEEQLQTKSIQRQEAPEEEELQMAAVQRRCAECATEDRAQRQEDEELLQGASLQRQEEEEPLQMQAAEEEEPVQGAFAQRQEEEEELQATPLQRQEDEELLQGAALQRQEDEELMQVAALQRQEEKELLQGAALQRQEEGEEPVQAKAAGGEPGLDTGRAARAINAVGGGSALSPTTQAEMGQRFGADFSGVRIHSGGAANEAAGALNARAFTRGSDIYMGQGASPTDRRLMGHELTHVVQQTGSQVSSGNQSNGGLIRINSQFALPGVLQRTEVGAVLSALESGDWDVDSRAAQLTDDQMATLSTPNRIRIISYIANGYSVLSSDEQTILRLFRTTPAALRTSLVGALGAALLQRLESVLHGEEYQQYHVLLRGLFFGARSASQAVQEAESARTFPWADPGLIRAIWNVRFYYEVAEFTDQGRIRFVYWTNIAFTGVRNQAVEVDPMEMILVHFYDDETEAGASRGQTIPMPAVSLLSLVQKQFRGEMQTVADVALIGLGGAGLMGASTRLGRAIAAIELAFGTADVVVRSFRPQIARSESGRSFLAVWDVVSIFIMIYGFTRLAIEGGRIFLNLRRTWQAFQGSDDAVRLGDQLDPLRQQVDEMLDRVDEARAAQQGGTPGASPAPEGPAPTAATTPPVPEGPAPSAGTTPPAPEGPAPTTGTPPPTPAIPGSTPAGRTAGPEVWDEITRELELGAPSSGRPRGSATTAREAREAGLVGERGAPGSADLAVQPHGRAPDVRSAFSITGREAQSAHIGPTSFLRRVLGYSRRAADTVLMDPATHRAFDNHWKAWARSQRRAGRTHCSAGELYDVMLEAIDQIPGLPQRTKNAIAWRLDLEFFRDLRLARDTVLELPYRNIRPASTP